MPKGRVYTALLRDNFSGLLSSVTLQQLYNMSTHNGLDMDWNAWVGQVRVSGHPSTTSSSSTSVAFSGQLTLTSVDWTNTVGTTWERVQPNVAGVLATDHVVASWNAASGALGTVPLKAFASAANELTFRVDAKTWLEGNGYQSFVTGNPGVAAAPGPVAPAPGVSSASAFTAALGSCSINWAIIRDSTAVNVANPSFFALPGTGSAGVNTSTPVYAGGVAPGVGSILVLKPSQDITLQEGKLCPCAA